VRVKDDGVGIAPELLPRVFELFTQGDRSLARSEGGLGIGLTLVKRLVELQLANLLTNAAKYTPDDGHLSVTVTRDDGDAVVGGTVEVHSDGCAGDAALRRRVEALLKAHAAAGQFLEDGRCRRRQGPAP
jgi:signal transduction histidine kinase